MHAYGGTTTTTCVQVLLTLVGLHQVKEEGNQAHEVDHLRCKQALLLLIVDRMSTLFVGGKGRYTAKQSSLQSLDAQ